MTAIAHEQDPTVGYVKDGKGKKHEVAMACGHMVGPLIGPCSTLHKHSRGGAHECRFLCDEYLAAVPPQAEVTETVSTAGTSLTRSGRRKR